MNFPAEAVQLLSQLVANPNTATGEQRSEACQQLAAYAQMKIDTTGQQRQPREELEAIVEAMPSDSRQLMFQRLLAWAKSPEDNGMSFVPPWGLIYVLACAISWGE